MQAIKTLISIINFRNFSDTIACLQQLQEFDYSNCSVIVIDNNSQNGSVEKIKKIFPDIHIIESPINNGFAAGHKISADYAIKNNFDLLWILNPDVLLTKNTLPELIKAYQQNGNAIYGSISVSETEPDKIEFGGAYGFVNGKRSIDYDFCKGKSATELIKTANFYKVGAVEGFSMMIPVNVIKEHGFMDTRFFMYGEETEYCLRINDKKISSYIVPGSVVVHKGEGSFQKSEAAQKVIAYYRARNYRIIAKKYFGLSNSGIIKNVGGIKALLGFFIKWYTAGKTFRNKNEINYFHNLGVLHSIFHIMGKKVKPEKYL